MIGLSEGNSASPIHFPCLDWRWEARSLEDLSFEYGFKASEEKLDHRTKEELFINGETRCHQTRSVVWFFMRLNCGFFFPEHLSWGKGNEGIECWDKQTSNCCQESSMNSAIDRQQEPGLLQIALRKLIPITFIINSSCIIVLPIQNVESG